MRPPPTASCHRTLRYAALPLALAVAAAPAVAQMTESPGPAGCVINPPHLPPHQGADHRDRTLDGFGDMSFQPKYRILSANERHGTYLLSS